MSNSAPAEVKAFQDVKVLGQGYAGGTPHSLDSM